MIYKRYEPSGVVASSALLLVLPGVLVFILRSSFAGLLATTGFVYGGFWLTIIMLVVGYRLSPLHPLASFPGPVLCKISKLWLTHIVRQGKAHLYVRSLHAKYGDVVRIGKSQLMTTRKLKI